MELLIGARVMCRDGEAGRLRYVVVDPATEAITELIVAHGHILKRDIVVPLNWVAHTNGDQIMLNAALVDLKRLPTYREVEYLRPDPSYAPVHGHRLEDTRMWIGPYLKTGSTHRSFADRIRLGIDQDGEVLIRRGLPVRAADGRTIGKIHHLVADDQHHLAYLVVQCGNVLHREYRIVPVDQIEALHEDGVRLKVPATILTGQPRSTAAAMEVHHV